MGRGQEDYMSSLEEDIWLSFLDKGGQQTHEKMLNGTHHKGNTNQTPK